VNLVGKLKRRDKVAVAESKLIVVVALPYRHHLREEWKRKMSAPRVQNALLSQPYAGLASLLHRTPATSATSAVMLAWSRTKRNLHPKKEHECHDKRESSDGAFT
jgi:hypothetical protein